jgi:two-component system sensor histidine kinase/response regulator
MNQYQRQNRKMVYQSKRAMDLLLGLVNDVLDFSKIEAKKVQTEKSLFNLREVIGDVEAIIFIQAEKKGLSLNFGIPQEIPDSLVGDGRHLSQVLINLLTNAVKFTQNGHVTLTLAVLRHDADMYRIEFSVEDTGIGMLAEKLDQIFDPYVQAESSTASKFGGTGLGLYISRSLVEIMGGSLGVESNPGQGSTFRFTLDFGVFNSDTIDPKSVSPAANTGNTIAGNTLEGRNILVVDDNKLIRTLAI